MVSKTTLWIARALWALPLLLLALGFYQIRVAADLRRTLEQGVPAKGTVTEYKFSKRADVTYDFVSLRVQMPDGSVAQHDRLSLPHTIAADLQGDEVLDVRVLPGSRQPVVIERLGRAHWRLAGINAAMCFVGFAMFAVAVFAWNRYLKRKGDPGLAAAPAAGSLRYAG